MLCEWVVVALVNSSVGNGTACVMRGASSVFASVGSLSIHGRGFDYRPLALPASIGAIGSSTLNRCQTRETERGLTSLTAGASLELVRRLVH